MSDGPEPPPPDRTADPIWRGIFALETPLAQSLGEVVAVELVEHLLALHDRLLSCEAEIHHLKEQLDNQGDHS
jgi:hypothetical protein